MTLIDKKFKKYKKVNNMALMKKYDAEKGIVMTFGNIRRYFCECGQVGTYNNNGYRNLTCEACGNDKFSYLGNFFRGRGHHGKIKTNLSRNESTGIEPLILIEHFLSFEVDREEETIELCETSKENLRVEFGEVKGSIGTSYHREKLNTWSLNEIKTKSSYFTRVEDLYNILEKKSQNNTDKLNELYYLMNVAVNHPHVNLKEFVKNNDIWRYINKNEPSLWSSIVDLDDFLKIKKIDKKLAPMINKFYPNGSLYYWYGYDEFFNEFSLLQEQEKDVIVNCLDQKTLTIHEVKSFTIQLKNLKEDVEYKGVLPLFPGFLKENIIIYSGNVIMEFKNRVDFLRKNSLEVNEYSLKTKQYNLSRNYVELSETQKIPKEKVDIFIDLIDKEPLKALRFIKDRRKLTKKQIDEIMAMQED